MIIELKKKLFKGLKLLCACAGLIILCASCTSEITVELKKDGSVDVQFSGAAGTAFATLMNSANGVTDPEADHVVFNTKEIEYELGANGFSKVKAVSKTGSDLTISVTDKNQKSALFTSGVISVKDGKLNASLSPETLIKYYDSTDSQTKMYLDMLLAPVFNDEVMTQEEYLEVLSTFYGEEIAEEMKSCNFRITLKNPDGSQTVQSINFTKLLCLNEVIYLR